MKNIINSRFTALFSNVEKAQHLWQLVILWSISCQNTVPSSHLAN